MLKRRTPMKRTAMRKRSNKPTRMIGERLWLSAADYTKMRRKRWEDHSGVMFCAICGCPIRCFEEYSVDHIKIKGMGGANHDDRPENLRDTHILCNTERGSKPA